MKTRRIVAISAMVVILLLGIQSSSTALTLGFNDGVNPFFIITDNGVGDSNPLIGAITFNGAIGTWIVNVTTGVSKPIIGSAAAPQLDLNSLNVTSAAGGNLRFALVESGFTGPLTGAFAGPFQFLVGGTTQGTASFMAFGDANNQEDFGSTAMFGTLGPFGPGAFSGTTGGAFGAAGPFSLIIAADILHSGGGAQTTSFNASINVPEPTSLILLGAGLLSLGLFGGLCRQVRKD